LSTSQTVDLVGLVFSQKLSIVDIGLPPKITVGTFPFTLLADLLTKDFRM
jgi:hypothetical protein